MRRAVLILVAVVMLGLVVPTGADAHVSNVTPAVVLAPLADLPAIALRAGPPVAGPIPLVLGLVAGLIFVAVSRRQPRRAFVLALVVLLAVFAVESGIHSVHHLGERSATACVLAAAGHLTLCLQDVSPVVAALLGPTGTVADERLAVLAAPGLGRVLARAPPAPIA